MTEQNEAPEIITLGGRQFRPVTETTIRQDQYCFGLIHALGLNAVSLQPGEAAESFAQRLLGACMGSEKVFDLLGGLIVPVETGSEGWSPSVAAETALFIAGLKEAEDKARTHSLVASMLMDFFVAGISSLERSTGSSQQQLDPGATSSDPPASTPPTTDSVTGWEQSGFSPEAIKELQTSGGTGG